MVVPDGPVVPSAPPPTARPSTGPVAREEHGFSPARAIVTAVLGGLGLWTLRDFLPALAWAGVFAVAMWPFYEKVQRLWPWRHRSSATAALFTAVVALIFILPLIFAAVQVGREIHGVIEWIHTMRKDGLPVPDWLAMLPVGAGQAVTWWQDNLADPAAASEWLGRLDRTAVVHMTGDFGIKLAHRVLLFAFMLLTLFFLFRDGRALATQAGMVSHRYLGSRGERLTAQIIASIHGTVDGLVLVGIGEGLALAVVYAVAKVPHPALFGAITAVLAMIPFGAPVVYGIASLLLLTRGASMAAIAVYAAGSVVVFVADHFVRPVLIGGATRLPFLWVLLGILGGVETFGLLGLFLGPALMAALVSLWREWTSAPACRNDPAASQEGSVENR